VVFFFLTFNVDKICYQHIMNTSDTSVATDLVLGAFSDTRAHVLAWRKPLEAQLLSGSTIRRKLAALASRYEFLCDRNAVTANPVKGVKRPRVDTYEGKTPALGDHQARDLLAKPSATTLKGLRDQAQSQSL
jgi:site-specific recombinase XerD